MENQYRVLYGKLARLQWLLQRNHMLNHAERGPFADATRGQGRVLAMLKMQPEISTRDLAYLMGIRHQSLNELLNKLEKAEYITRSPSEADRRMSMVRLTEKGKEQEHAKHDFSGIFDCLSQEEQANFAEYLDRVTAALEAELGMDTDEEELSDWADAARERMGDEMFERLMSMRGGFHQHRHHDRDFRRGFEGYGHGPAPECMPGAERFHPDYAGPMPHGHGGHGRRQEGHRNPPPPPPSPYEPDDE